MSRSLVSLVYNEFEQEPFSFIELLVYAVGLLTFTFYLVFAQDIQYAVRLSRDQSHYFSLSIDLNYVYTYLDPRLAFLWALHWLRMGSPFSFRQQR